MQSSVFPCTCTSHSSDAHPLPCRPPLIEVHSSESQWINDKYEQQTMSRPFEGQDRFVVAQPEVRRTRAYTENLETERFLSRQSPNSPTMLETQAASREC